MGILNVPEPTVVSAPLASQPHFGDLAVGVMRTLEEDGVRFAVLRLDAPDVQGDRVRLNVGESMVIAHHGRLTVIDVLPSTRERRGWVRLEFAPAP